MQIFVDMDGVLADFDRHHEETFGFRSDKLLDNVDWGKVAAVPNFYAGIPMMADAQLLWNFLLVARQGRPPIVLTGIPASVAEAADNKRQWVARNFGSNVEVRCCRSKEKCLHAQPGDILIDDWEKYRDLWIAKGGRWITHTSAADTVEQLQKVLYERKACDA
jgi:hypothetical protein